MSNLYKCFNCKNTPCITPDICNKVSEDFLKTNKMEKNTLTAKEWLGREQLLVNGKLSWTSDPTSVMNRYAYYRTRELEEKIMNFRTSFSKKFNYLCDGQGFDAQEDVENFIDDYFNITSETNGK